MHLTWDTRGAKDGFQGSQSRDLAAMTRLAVANSPEEDADFVLVHGTEALTQRRCEGGGEEEVQVMALSEEEVEALLQRCQARRLPMLVANPDLVTVQGSALVKMPGAIARRYRELGADPQRVHLLGKPEAVIYEVARRLFLGDTPKRRIVCVGDSLEHDIRGGQAFGIDSVFVASGIHAADLPWEGQGQLDQAAMANLVRKLGIANPTITVKHFQ